MCCRERRKQRFQELEGALNALTDQMNEKQTEVSDLWVSSLDFHGTTYFLCALHIVATMMFGPFKVRCVLQNKNASLQGKTQELSTALQSKEAEVQALRNQVLSMQVRQLPN